MEDKTYSLHCRGSVVVATRLNGRDCGKVETRRREKRREESVKKISELELLSWAERVGKWVKSGEGRKNGHFDDYSHVTLIVCVIKLGHGTARRFRFPVWQRRTRQLRSRQGRGGDWRVDFLSRVTSRATFQLVFFFASSFPFCLFSCAVFLLQLQHIAFIR